jgi:hypothetical protein
MATTTPNFGWSVPTSGDFVKNGATAIETLGDSIDASMMDLKGGTTGQVLAKATGTDMDFTWTTASAGSTYVAGKNFAINGGFDIFQRSTFTSQTSSAYALDRWYAGVGGTVTITQQTTGAPVGSQYCMRVAYNAASSFANQFQALESANATALAGQTVTASVLVRANASWAATSGQSLSFFVEKNSTANTLTGGTWSTISSAVVTAASISTGTTSTSWTKLTITCAIPNDGTAAGLRLKIGEAVVGPSGAYWEMAQCQLEISSTATAFARTGGNIQGELAACQRYYQRYNFPTATGGGTVVGTAVNTTIFDTLIIPLVSFRVAPTAIDSLTLSMYYPPAGGQYNTGAFTIASFSTPNQIDLRYTHGSAVFTAGMGGYLTSSGNNGYLGLTAEL